MDMMRSMLWEEESNRDKVRRLLPGAGEQWSGPFHLVGRGGKESDGLESTLPLKVMQQEDELDAKGHCEILFLETPLHLDG